MMNSVIHGNCLEILPTLDADSIHCCVTSPPYYGLRDYGHADQIGLEESPDAYVAKMVAVFREVRRVLRDDGTLWLNLGDSYAGSGKGAWDRTDVQKEVYVPKPGGIESQVPKVPSGLKPKDLIGIPWRVAFALQADGWYLRQDIVWHKPNAMPESVTDRCTKAHEYVFLLSKSARYYYDAAAIVEPFSSADEMNPNFRKNRKSDSRKKHTSYCVACDGSGDETDENGDDCSVCGGTGLDQHSMVKPAVKNTGVWLPEGAGRNRRSVWTVATQPYKEAHFATFPPALIEPCIKAGCPPDGTVLDPFGGAGTTGVVAYRLNRAYTLIELNAEYVAMAEKRIALERSKGVREVLV